MPRDFQTCLHAAQHARCARPRNAALGEEAARSRRPKGCGAGKRGRRSIVVDALGGGSGTGHEFARWSSAFAVAGCWGCGTGSSITRAAGARGRDRRYR
jgi:hypothetical protein